MEKEELLKTVNNWKNGNEEAYSILYKEYHDRMLKIALKHTQISGNSNQADAEDVVQDAMMKAYVNIQSLDDLTKFESWLTRIVVNKANDYMTSAMKKKNVLQTDYAQDDGEGKFLEFDVEDNKRERQPEIKLDAEVKQAIVQDILGGLSEDQRAVTIMYYYDEMTMKEIAEQLGIEMSTVAGRLQTAKKNIKNEVTVIQKRDDIKLYNLSAIPAISLFMSLLGTAKETAATPVINGETAIVGTHPESTVKPSQKGAVKRKNSTSSVVNHSNNIMNATSSVSAAGASFATKLIAGIAVAAAVAGGGIAIKNNLSVNDMEPAVSASENQDSEQADSEEKTDETANEPKVTDEGNIIGYSFKIPEGWTGQNEMISTDWTRRFDAETPVYAVYSGEPGDKTKPFVMISSLDATGLGGTYGEEGAPKSLTYYDSYVNSVSMVVNCVSGPLSDMGLEYPFVKGYSGVSKDEECYEYRISFQGEDIGRAHFQIIYFPMGDESRPDNVKGMVDSFFPNFKGTLEINVDKMNVRFSPSVSAPAGQQAIQGETFTVYQIVEAEGYTWYRVGSCSWIADNGQGWVTYNNEFIQD